MIAMPTTEWNPMRVGLGSSSGGPYTSPGSNIIKAGQVSATNTAPAPAQTSTTVGPESVRATGTGPGDASWRQNLATFSGGQFQRPGGFLGFDPTSAQPFGGAPTGGGTAPVFGMPSTLLSMALGGQPFSFAPPAPQQSPQSTSSGDSTFMDNNDWLSRYMRGGGMVSL